MCDGEGAVNRRADPRRRFYDGELIGDGGRRSTHGSGRWPWALCARSVRVASADDGSLPDARVGARQRACGAAECRRARHRAADRARTPAARLRLGPGVGGGGECGEGQIGAIARRIGRGRSGGDIDRSFRVRAPARRGYRSARYSRYAGCARCTRCTGRGPDVGGPRATSGGSGQPWSPRTLSSAIAHDGPVSRRRPSSATNAAAAEQRDQRSVGDAIARSGPDRPGGGGRAARPARRRPAWRRAAARSLELGDRRAEPSAIAAAPRAGRQRATRAGGRPGPSVATTGLELGDAAARPGGGGRVAGVDLVEVAAHALHRQPSRRAPDRRRRAACAGGRVEIAPAG